MRYTGVKASYLPYITRETVSDSVLVVVPSVQEAEMVAADMPFFKAKSASFLRWDILPFDQLSPSGTSVAARLNVLTSPPPVVVTSVDALTQRLLPPDVYKNSARELRSGDEQSVEHLSSALVRLGYVKTSLVEEPGQFAVKGHVVDFFSPAGAWPLRVELFGDEILEVRSFSPATQLSDHKLDSCTVYPAREFFTAACDRLDGWQDRITKRVEELGLPSSQARVLIEAIREDTLLPGMEHLVALFSETTATLLDYLPEDTEVVLFNEHDLSLKLDEFESVLREQIELASEDLRIYPQLRDAYQTPDEVLKSLKPKVKIQAETVSALEGRKVNLQDMGALTVQLKAARNFEPLKKELNSWFAKNYRVGIVCGQKEKRFAELLEIPANKRCASFDEFLDQPAGSITFVQGELTAGLEDRLMKFALLSEADVFPSSARRRSRKSPTQLSRLLGKVNQLSEGDFVVHEDHGIARYQGLEEVSVDGVTGDFLLLEFAENSKLYIPVDSIGKVQKYVAAEGKEPKLSKLGTRQWDQTKEKVQKRVAELAGKLISIYANRSVAERESYGALDNEDADFADAFGYQETVDQAKAIEDVLGDLESPRPMDRLVCGDVGYGKTEVALRAAFKVANSGKQVALLVPTTILCEQHYKNFIERFEGFGPRVDMVSRFRTSKENKATVEKLKTGEIDIIVGTHRLLSRDVQFRNLGLIVIDEEHRFGVAHKERLKEFRAKVDVLTLTATPIPRTLHMSLTSIRELSVIETPPVDRQVTRTYVSPYSERVVREAIVRELSRQGQVFYLYNRVQSIAGVCADLRELVPEAKIEFAHGQMSETELSEVMHRFINAEIDILVSTTIVESGLDIPNANTMIITNADKLGLAELYQLRGRVGRSSRRAYCYLLVDNVKSMTEDAKKRLQVLESLDDLGQGFRLALRDMEIRGAGNLLGKDQSGQVGLVGFELYSKILKEAIESRREEKEKDDPDRLSPFEPEVHIGMSCYFPASYIGDVQDRLILYQRLIELKSEHEISEMQWEVKDRFGNYPVEVEQLFELTALKLELKEKGIVFLKTLPGKIKISFHPDLVLDPGRVASKIAAAGGKLSISPSMMLTIKTDSELESIASIREELAEAISELL